MNVYIYCADIYCEQCGIKIMADCIASGKYPDDIDDETSYDSDEFPKGPFENGGGESDCPQHCGSGGDCVNAYTPDGWFHRKVGMFLENDLTSDGIEYVVTGFLDDRSNPVCIEHVKFYAGCGYSLEREYNGVTVRLS
jgi:hypothetical protein